MATKTKPDPRKVLARLSDTEQHTLYEFLRTNSYDKAAFWLQSRHGLNVSPRTICRWWSWYASRQLAVQLTQETTDLAKQLKTAGVKVTKENLDDWALDFFQRHAALGLDSEAYLRYFSERKKLEIME